jgi:hypothetical protein
MVKSGWHDERVLEACAVGEGREGGACAWWDLDSRSRVKLNNLVQS